MLDMPPLWMIWRSILWKNFFTWTHIRDTQHDKQSNMTILISKEQKTQNTKTKKIQALMLQSPTKNLQVKWFQASKEFFLLKLWIKDKNNKLRIKYLMESTILAKVRVIIKILLKIKTKTPNQILWKQIIVAWWTSNKTLTHWKWSTTWVVKTTATTFLRVDQIKWIQKSPKEENQTTVTTLTFKATTILYCHL